MTVRAPLEQGISLCVDDKKPHSCDRNPAVALRAAGKFNSVCGASGTKMTDASGFPSQEFDLEKNGSDALTIFRTGLFASKEF